MYSIIMGNKGKCDEAPRFGKLALKMSERFPAPETETMTYFLIAAFVQPLTKPVQDSIDPLIYGHRLGLQTGQIEFACFSAAVYSGVYLHSGLPLGAVREDLRLFEKIAVQYDQPNALVPIRIFRQVVLNLFGESENPLLLTGEAMDEKRAMTVA